MLAVKCIPFYVENHVNDADYVTDEDQILFVVIQRLIRYIGVVAACWRAKLDC